MGSERARAMPDTNTKTILLDLLQRMKTLILRGEQRPEATGLQPVSQPTSGQIR